MGFRKQYPFKAQKSKHFGLGVERLDERKRRQVVAQDE
jgi:hypothetical protein